MMHENADPIIVQVQPFFIEEQSRPDENHYVFAYVVQIQNTSAVPAKLLARHWIITDSNGRVQEVRGEGVVGVQPYLRPGEAFQYTSGAVLETPVGTMHGSYEMVTDEGDTFKARIPSFTLSVPRTLH